jgi:uncharacterized delta-60 repeat protein
MTCYKSNGELDSTFGNNGVVQYLIGGFSPFDETYMCGIKLEADSSIISAGYMSGLCIIKFHSNGTVDSSFATNGILLDPSSNFHPNDIAIDFVGRILLAGYDYVDWLTPSDFAVRRFSSTGVFDSSYGGNGEAITDFFNQDDVVTSVTMVGDENIIVAGSADSSNTKNIALAKYDQSGFLDPSFGNNGKVTINLVRQTLMQKSCLCNPTGSLLLPE